MNKAFVLSTLICLVFLGRTDAQNYSESDLRSEQTIQVTLSAESQPTSKKASSLYPDANELYERNAAIYYHRAVYQHNISESNLQAMARPGQEPQTYSNDFTEKLTPEVLQKMKRWLAIYENVELFQEIGYAVYSRHCDWQLIPEEVNSQWFLRLLPEIQGCRSLARFLATKARVEIHEGRYNQACQTIRYGLRLSADLQKSEYLVGSLVGLACLQIMEQPFLELIQADNSPNLYWSLAKLPSSITDIHIAIRAELSRIKRGSGFELLINPEQSRSSEEWRRLLNDFGDQMMVISGISDIPNIMPAAIVRAYPIAKQMLLNDGMTEDQIAELNTIQAVVMADNMVTDRLVAEYEKGLTMEPKSGSEYFAQLESNELRTAFQDQTVTDLPLLGHGFFLIPAVQQCFTAGTNARRRLVSIQVIEAIRDHVGKTGELPNSLEDIKDLPIPRNPETGEPFRYTCNGNSAKLFDFGLQAYQARIYEISLEAK